LTRDGAATAVSAAGAAAEPGARARSDPRPHVAVVGAGLAGLAAGLELTRAGCRVTLVERSRLLGGKATSFRVGDREVDNGQHVVLGCCDQFLALAAELGMGGQIRMQTRFEVLMLTERGPARLRAMPLPAPLHLAIPFLGFAGLRPGDRLAVVRALLAARRRKPAREAAETFATWLDRHRQGPGARRGFWEPFVVPAVNAPLSAVSAADALFVVRTAFLGDRDAARIGWATVPLARVAERAAARLDSVRLRTPVTTLRVVGGRLRGLTLAGDQLEVDAAVLAVPPERLRRIAGADALGLGDLGRFRTEPIVDVHLLYEGGRDVGFEFAALIGSPVQWVFAKGPGYLCCSMSQAADWVGQPEERLVAMADAELRARLPALAAATLRHGAATRDPEATFVPAPGLRRPGPVTALANVTVAGAWTDTGWPATMEGAVRSGRAAARLLLPELSAIRAAGAPIRG
jgi:squalene-associated FAD-dependent desaturase